MHNVAQIYGTKSPCTADISHLLNSNTHFPFSLAHGSHNSTPYFYEYVCFRLVTWVESCDICPSLTGLFRLV